MRQSAGQPSITLFATPPHPCGYLPDREAVTLFADPHARKNASVYAHLSAQGFRRSGEHLYRPRCPGCHACVPVRVPVREFTPSRCQRRAGRRNADLHVEMRSAEFRAEHFALYARYLRSRHPGGGMDNPTPVGFIDFLTATWVDTRFIEFRDDEGRLLAVAVADLMEGALSAVYTFFDPDAADRSLGRHAILTEIDYARRLGLDWLYLGYYIPECRKMRYKAEYRPLEFLIDGHWSRRCPGEALHADED